MASPFVSYVTFNRLGMTIQNLSALLSGADDFELHIVDCNSKDDTWDYLMSLTDSRIKSRTHMEINHGKVYALNMNLIQRAPEQYYFHMDNDVRIETPDWISRFMNVFEAFPDVGLLGATEDGAPPLPLVEHRQEPAAYLELVDNASNMEEHYVPSSCMAMSPGLLKEIGYFCEENYAGGREVTYRTCNHTGFKAGFVPDVRIARSQPVDCSACSYAAGCKVYQGGSTCFKKYEEKSLERSFWEKYRWKFEETVRDLKSGARSVYCASLLDAASTQQHFYNMDWSMENFYYYINNGN